VLFDSWGGTYCDSPRAISEELRRRDPELRQVWLLREANGASAEVPPGVVPAAPGSWLHLHSLKHCSHIVANSTLPRYFRKPADTSFLQTWHGTPLKRIAFDIENPQFDDHRKHYASLRREVAAWDFLVSPNAFSTEVFRQAFRFDGPILETGYPRNDMLVGVDAAERRLEVRSRLGLDEDAFAVLYAPTWRDAANPARPVLDLKEVAREVEGTVVLLRAHQLDHFDLPAGDGRVRDVSRYPEVGDLYLASDVLVTDYSSVMFDYAITGKPILFFTYDLSYYRDQLRGFYFDFEAEAPGPLLETPAEVVAALQRIDAVTGESRHAYERFRAKFCHLDDGKASARVVETVFGDLLP
jgi:CDP-glycerol glycerophosphotransferase